MRVGVMTVGVMSVREITVGVTTVGVMTVRVMRRPHKYNASKRTFEKRNKTLFGARGQTETSLKIADLKSNKTYL